MRVAPDVGDRLISFPRLFKILSLNSTEEGILISTWLDDNRAYLLCIQQSILVRAGGLRDPPTVADAVCSRSVHIHMNVDQDLSSTVPRIKAMTFVATSIKTLVTSLQERGVVGKRTPDRAMSSDLHMEFGPINTATCHPCSSALASTAELRHKAAGTAFLHRWINPPLFTFSRNFYKQYLKQQDNAARNRTMMPLEADAMSQPVMYL